MRLGDEGRVRRHVSGGGGIGTRRGALAFAVTWRLRTGLGVLLDLLLAAGLLRLAAQPTWTGIATAAAIVAVRKLVGFGLAQVEHTRTG